MNIHEDLFEVIKMLNENDYEVQVQMTLYPGHAIEIAQNAHDVDLVICSGGDGTLSQVASGLIRGDKHLPIGYIPGGSTNDYARTLKLSTDANNAIQEILNGHAHEFDVGDFDECAHFVYIASFGLFTAASYNTPQSIKNDFGPLAYFLGGIADLVNAKTHHVKVTINDEVIEDDYILGIVSNTLSIGGIMKLNPSEVDLSDGLFEVLLIKAPRDIGAYTELINGLITKNFANKQIFAYAKASEIELEFDEALSWSLDGEETKANKVVKIKNLPKQMMIVKYP
jgi:YegS/Rv2252/BmrU family lipid kinase